MPVTPTYPGVYIEEIPSGVRTITGVATSITAFVGRAKRGPVDEPITINNYGDFERRFGGLWNDSTLGFAVRDFYLNGGAQAIIVRLFHPTFADDNARQTAFTTAKTEAQAGADVIVTAVNDALTNDPNAKAQQIADAAMDAATTDVPNDPKAGKDAANALAEVAKEAVPETESPGQIVITAVTNAVAQIVDGVAGAAAPITKATLIVDTLTLEAAYEGSWGNNLRARVDHDVSGDDAANLFNLTIRDDATGQTELFRNVSVVGNHARQVDKVLDNQSSLVRAKGILPADRPNAHEAPAVDKPLWGDNGTNSKVADDSKASDGNSIDQDDFIGTGKAGAKKGLYALEKVNLFNLLCIPPYNNGDVDNPLITAAATYCEQKRAFLIIDPKSNWVSKENVKGGLNNGGVGTKSKNSALFFPRLRQRNPLKDNQFEDFVPCGAVAGIFSRTDATRGVWKAPAGLEATLNGVPQLSVPLTNEENGELNPLGVNCLRTMVPAGRVIWGSRTLQGDDRFASEWKYIPVRRTALFIEESLYRGTQWVVFEPNDEPLWAQIRLNIGAFMHNLFRQGAFQGSMPRDAYLVKCDKETTTQNDINLGIVNIVVGFAPLKPAEFVIIKLQQLAGQIDV
ncbi:MAG: phage tail sheath family protein [Chloroflexi bacterium]|nr:MAG: phage tail sheath family protein [Chloroflexota bacterium]